MTKEKKCIDNQKWFIVLRDKLFSPIEPVRTREKMPFKAIEWVAVIGISLFYALFAFGNLGTSDTPQTSMEIPKNQALEFEVPQEAGKISTVCWSYWEMPQESFKVEVRPDSESEWIPVDKFGKESIFGCWKCCVLPGFESQVRIIHDANDVSLREVLLLDFGGNALLPVNSNEYPELFDEQEMAPKEFNSYTSFYFDEFYYGPTAYEYINGLEPFERTHPPMGKNIIALGILLFGYTPFAIRFFGTLLGVFMLPLIYLMARNLVRHRGIAAFAMFIFAFDFMHFTQTRIATIDVYITFFIIVMYYFMERYLNMSFYDTSLKKTWIPLGCCGIAFGFGVATKWTGFYAGLGLAILFFARVIRYYREYRYACSDPEGTTNDMEHGQIIAKFKGNTIKTICFCVVFYVMIPFVIYLLSYIPFVDVNNAGLFDKMIANQKYMFEYHSQANFYNEYTSRWYEWPLMIRPMGYYVANVGGIARQGVYAMGNPLVWWVGIPAFFYTLYSTIKRKAKAPAFLCVGYLAQYLPWVFVSRPTFIYHYFTSVPFVVLMIGYWFLQIKEKTVEKKILDEKSFGALLFIYAVAAYGLFQLFLPVISGETFSIYYVEDYLHWLKEWDFCLRK